MELCGLRPYVPLSPVHKHYFSEAGSFRYTVLVLSTGDNGISPCECYRYHSWNNSCLFRIRRSIV